MTLSLITRPGAQCTVLLSQDHHDKYTYWGEKILSFHHHMYLYTYTLTQSVHETNHRTHHKTKDT